MLQAGNGKPLSQPKRHSPTLWSLLVYAETGPKSKSRTNKGEF